MHYPLAFLPLTACLPRKGAGSIASPLMTALEREPDAILGKPAQNMLQSILAEYVPVIH